jgi:uncharacterized protein YjbI with pentapeptide repeats
MDNYYSKYIKYKNKYLELKGVKGDASINNGNGDVNSGAYYTKYMKYKTKYIKEKGLVGGVLGSEPCPTTFGFVFERSVGHYLRNYKCTYNDLFKKIPNKLNEFTHDAFKRTNEKHPQQQITIANLKERGFSASFLKEKEFHLYTLMKEGQFTAKELKKAGYSVKQLQNAGKSVRSDYFKFTLQELIDAEYDVMELISEGYTIEDLIRVHISASQLMKAGFTASALKGAGFDLLALKIAGFDLLALKIAGFDASALKGVGFDASALKGVGFDAIALKGAGFDAFNLKQAGFNALEFKKAGFDANNLKSALFTALELKNAGFTLSDLKEARFTLSDLKEAGFTLSDLQKVGYGTIQLKEAGFTLDELLKLKYETDLGNIIKLKEEGFNAKEIKKKGYSLNKIKNAELFSYEELKEAGVKFIDLLTTDEKNLRSSIPDDKVKKLKEAGFSITDFKGISSDILLKAGFTLDELKKEKISIKNITLKNLKDEGYSAIELKKLGFSEDELRDAMFNTSNFKDIEEQPIKEEERNALELKNEGFNAIDLKNAGYSAIELICAGYTPEQLKHVGYTQVDIDKATYLKHNRFTVKQLTGYTRDQLTGYTQDQLIDAGYISILKDGKTVYPVAYIDDTLLLLRPRVLASLFETKDKRIQFLEYRYAYKLFYSKLKVYVYQKYGNEENMKNVKTNWKISLYGCHKSDPIERHLFDVKQFNKEQSVRHIPKPLGIYGSEMSNISSWIGYVLTKYEVDEDGGNITGRPGNCSGFLIFRLKNDDKILHILNKKDLEKLKPYLRSQFEDIKLYDWKAIAQKYHALNLQLVLKVWDVLTTVVWNIDAVADFHFITLRDLPFVRNFVNCESLFVPNDES